MKLLWAVEPHYVPHWQALPSFHFVGRQVLFLLPWPLPALPDAKNVNAGGVMCHRAWVACLGI